jgi:hypothetical protein
MSDLTPDDKTTDVLDDGPRPIKDKTKSAGGAIIGAAMFGIGEVFEPQNTDVNIAVEADLDSDGLDLDFGDLPGLE